MAVVESVEENCSWQCFFPFVGQFEQVVEGTVSLKYLAQLVCVLEPAVRVCAEVVEDGQITVDTVRALVYTTIALGRCRVALAYRVEVEDDECDKCSLLEELQYEWSEWVAAEGFDEVEYSDSVGALLDRTVRDLWIPHAVRDVYTASTIRTVYPGFVAAMRVRVVGRLLVVSDGGTRISDLDEGFLDYPVLSVEYYRVLMQRLKLVLLENVLDSPDTALQPASATVDIGYGVVESFVVTTWLWLVIPTIRDQRGYCYQLLYPPGLRYTACLQLGMTPLVAEVTSHIGSVVSGAWTERRALVHYDDVIHVAEHGFVDVSQLAEFDDRRIGMQSSSEDDKIPDYFARALVDDFFERNRPKCVTEELLQPLDTQLETLSVSSNSTVGREFVDVAKVLYSSVGATLSPRAELEEDSGGGLYGYDEEGDERDGSIVRDVCGRLSDGAVIDESYFVRTYRRFQSMRRRPRMTRSDGHMYHVFEAFPAEGGGGTGPWEIDKAWNFPSWRSYVAEFRRDEKQTVSFTPDTKCQDIRMDCSGAGMLEFGMCRVRVERTVLWFTNSVRFCLTTTAPTTLRISVPDAGGALAMGHEMRRYLHIRGYTAVIRSFDIVTSGVDFSVPMERAKRSSIAGCHVYTGQKHVERGRHRFKLGQLVSAAPARVVMRTDPPDAFEFVSISGMRLLPRHLDTVSVLVDLRNVEMFLSLRKGAQFVISMVQIANVYEYELAAASIKDARKFEN